MPMQSVTVNSPIPLIVNCNIQKSVFRNATSVNLNGAIGRFYVNSSYSQENTYNSMFCNCPNLTTVTGINNTYRASFERMPVIVDIPSGDKDYQRIYGMVNVIEDKEISDL